MGGSKRKCIVSINNGMRWVSGKEGLIRDEQRFNGGAAGAGIVEFLPAPVWKYYFSAAL